MVGYKKTKIIKNSKIKNHQSYIIKFKKKKKILKKKKSKNNPK